MQAAVIGVLLGCGTAIAALALRRLQTKRRRMSLIETEIRLIEERLARPPEAS